MPQRHQRLSWQGGQVDSMSLTDRYSLFQGILHVKHWAILKCCVLIFIVLREFHLELTVFQCMEPNYPGGACGTRRCLWLTYYAGRPPFTIPWAVCTWFLYFLLASTITMTIAIYWREREMALQDAYGRLGKAVLLIPMCFVEVCVFMQLGYHCVNGAVARFVSTDVTSGGAAAALLETIVLIMCGVVNIYLVVLNCLYICEPALRCDLTRKRSMRDGMGIAYTSIPQHFAPLQIYPNYSSAGQLSPLFGPNGETIVQNIPHRYMTTTTFTGNGTVVEQAGPAMLRVSERMACLNESPLRSPAGINGSFNSPSRSFQSPNVNADSVSVGTGATGGYGRLKRIAREQQQRRSPTSPLPPSCPPPQPPHAKRVASQAPRTDHGNVRRSAPNVLLTSHGPVRLRPGVYPDDYHEII